MNYTHLRKKIKKYQTGAAMTGLEVPAINPEDIDIVGPEEEDPGNGWVSKSGKTKFSEKQMNKIGIGTQIASAAFQGMDEAMNGDKNFGAQSQAIDNAVHGASSALMKSGNPFAMMAGAAIEGVNFLTKAGGNTVQGFDVPINNSGYGNLAHQESSSSRGLFGIDFGGTKDKLARRNAQAKMALQAGLLSADNDFEQSARRASTANIIQSNQVALSGGLDTGNLAG